VVKKLSKIMVVGFHNIARPRTFPRASRVIDWKCFHTFSRKVVTFSLLLFVSSNIKMPRDSIHTLFHKIHFFILPLIA
jgi:hypothetical protein